MTRRVTSKVESRSDYRAAGPAEDAATVSLSVVIPAYNEARRIPSTLRQVLAHLESLGIPFEVVVVDDGSTDETVAVVEQVARETDRLRLVRNPGNCGKGAAVRNGVLNARGEYILFSDADLSAPIEDAGLLLEPLRAGYDVAIGSRALKREWIGVHQPGMRETAGRVFNLAIRILTGLPFQDTQCGFKAFRRSAAVEIFPRQRIQGFSFDVETLYLARKLGYRTVEIAVHWNHCDASKVSPLSDGVKMFLQVLEIRWNDWMGKYRD